MNIVFGLILVVSTTYLTVTAPEKVLTAMNSGAEKSVKLSATLLVIYCVWLGVFRIFEEGKLTERIAKFLALPVRLVFGKVGKEAEKYLTLNVTANLFGLGSVATPMGIKAAETLDAEGDEYGKAMLFVVAATSIQLLPTTVISIRANCGSASPADVFLPTLLSTAVSTVCGVILTKVFVKR